MGAIPGEYVGKWYSDRYTGMVRSEDLARVDSHAGGLRGRCIDTILMASTVRPKAEQKASF